MHRSLVALHVAAIALYAIGLARTILKHNHIPAPILAQNMSLLHPSKANKALDCLNEK